MGRQEGVPYFDAGLVSLVNQIFTVFLTNNSRPRPLAIKLSLARVPSDSASYGPCLRATAIIAVGAALCFLLNPAVSSVRPSPAAKPG
jgi:hypothetical protein